MTKIIVLSERKTKAAAALAQMTLEEINRAAGLGVGYISRKWGSDGVTLATINRVAGIIGCSALELLEESDQPAAPDQPTPPPPAPAPSVAAQMRAKEHAALPSGELAADEQARVQRMEERRQALLAQAAGRQR